MTSQRAEAVPGARAVPGVEETRSRAAFEALGPEWDALAAATDDQACYRHGFLRAWLENFAPEAALRLLTLRSDDGELEAALPLVEQQVRWHGIPVRELASPTNFHSNRFDLLARDARGAAARFLSHLTQDRTWDALRIADVPEGGRGFALLASAEALGHPTGIWDSHRSPYLALPQAFENLRALLDPGFRANLRRRRRRLEERGSVRVERVGGGERLPSALAEGLALEARGWKGREGTAIVQDRAARGFYADVAQDASRRGTLALYFLRVNGRAVAFDYALEDDRRCLVLKTAYDETVAECSPGQLLIEEILKSCVARGLEEFDFLGEDMPWKHAWTDRVRRHSWLYVFRSDRWGRALRDLKFSWTPRVKGWMGRWSP